MKKTNKTKKSDLLELHIRFYQTQDGGEICAGEEEDSYPSHEPIYYSYSYTYASRVKITGFDLFKGSTTTISVSPDVLSCDKVFLAIVVYSDGDTFGSSYGHHQIIGGYASRKEAEEVLELITEEGYDIVGDDFIYCSWNGYFNSLQQKIVEQLDIEG